MVTDFEELVTLCDEELQHREYESNYYFRIKKQWDCLRKWMLENNLTEFNEEIGNRYCDEVFGTHLMPRGAKSCFREKLRASKNFELSDFIRDELSKLDITIKDKKI